MTSLLVPFEVQQQIDALKLDPNVPTIISDADEVLFFFVLALEKFIKTKGYTFKIRSFALSGNIEHVESGEIVPQGKVKTLLQEFFRDHTETILPVTGAAKALSELSKIAQIIVLSNVPLSSRDARRRALRRHGMDYPLIANSGLKGPAVETITTMVSTTTFFIDDIPDNIQSVAHRANQVVRIHFVADTRLAGLIDKAQYAHTRIDDWPTVKNYITHHIEQQQAENKN